MHEEDIMEETRLGISNVSPDDERYVDTVITDTANKAIALLQSDEYAAMTDTQKITALTGAVEFLEKDIYRMANIMSDMISNMNKLIDYADSIELFTRNNCYKLSQQVGKVKEANKPIMIVGGGKDVKENHEVDTEQKAEGLQAPVHRKDGS